MLFNTAPLLFLIPAIFYLLVIGILIWLVVRFVRSNERIADNTDRIARMMEMNSQSRDIT